tara:strand:- start:74799 stop:75869 length:1071 start_codon:yes stop_codon:yes gene_type:complete
MNNYLQKLLNICLEKHLNFVVCSYPNSSEFEIIIENQTVCNHTKSHFVFHPFEVSKQHPEIIISADYRINESLINDAFITDIIKIPNNEKPVNQDATYAISKDLYLENLTQAIDTLNNEGLEKFIYSRIKSISKPVGLDLSNYLYRLNKKHESAFVYLINHAQSGVWMGATPETLVNWTGTKISTMSLAGTQPNLGNAPKWSAKEKEEQAYVTQYILDAFSKSQIECNLSETETVKAGPVVHLQTNLTSVNNVSYDAAYSFAKHLHPTPAICGVPLEKAKDMIHLIEKHDRAYYTGYLGFIHPEKELKLFVNLRCLQVSKNNLALYIGGGITAKSNAEKEWDETNFKSETLLTELE